MEHRGKRFTQKELKERTVALWEKSIQAKIDPTKINWDRAFKKLGLKGVRNAKKGRRAAGIKEQKY